MVIKEKGCTPGKYIVAIYCKINRVYFLLDTNEEVDVSEVPSQSRYAFDEE